LGKTKDITSINIGSGKNLVIFEGWPDFEAFKSHYHFFDFEHSAIILGSTALVKRAIEEIKNYTYDHIFLYLDNDEAGRKATQKITDALKDDYSVTDKSFMYQNHTDFNEWVIDKKSS
jgi:5S rRNA maturation endonuclease (ribonuclease M5)